MHICTIIIVINLCAIITVMYSYANNLPYKQMWSHQAKAMTWVYLKIWIFFHFFTVYILNNVFCKFQVIPAENDLFPVMLSKIQLLR